MKFECDSCHAQYMIADEKVGKRGVKVKCKKCQHVIIVRPDAGRGAAAKAVAKEPVAPAAAAAPRKAERAGEREKPVFDLQLPPLAAPPPPGLDVSGPGKDDGDDAVAPGGAKAPSPASLGKAAPPTGDTRQTTGPNEPRPAPVSMFGDQTELTQNPMENLAADQTQQTLAGAWAPPSPSSEGADDSATQVTSAPEPRAKQTAPVPPPSIATDKEGIAAAILRASKQDTAASTDDALGDQLAGAFNTMFDAASDANGSGDFADDQRGPTRILDASTVDALRKQASASPDVPEQGSSAKSVGRKQSAPAAGADDGPPNQVWHLAIDDQEVGPMSIAEVGRHIEAGRVDRETLVWKTGMEDWSPAGDTSLLRPLFDRLPMPRIARSDDAGRAGSSSSGYGPSSDLGPPIDDGPPVAGGGSPFDDADDPSWRPHGLTDVYQAANLAEAAGAGGSLGMAMGAAASSLKPASSMSADEWRPAAASALASLVSDEIKRLDSGPAPARQSDLSPADDSSVNVPLFSRMPADRTLEVGPELNDPVGPAAAGNAPRRTSLDRTQAPSGYPPAQGFMATPRQGLSPLVIVAGIAGGVLLLVVLVLALSFVIGLKQADNGPRIVMLDGKAYVQGGDGNMTPLNGDKPSPPPPETRMAMPGLGNSDATKPGKDIPSEAVATSPTGGGAQPTEPPSLPKDVVVRPDPPSGRGTGPGSSKVIVEPPKPPVPPRKKSGDCDPVLDFDCKPGNVAPVAKEPAKESLSKADVLAVVKANMGKIASCGSKNKVGGNIKMSWKVLPTGNTSDVQVADSKFAGTPVGACVTSEVKIWKFPASKVATPVTFPMKLGG